MIEFKKEILITVGLLAIMVIVIQAVKLFIRRFSLLRSIEVNRRKVILNLNYVFIYGVTISVLAIVWGVDLRQFTVFISSVLAILGVGFFAQWSILSNLTASVILFFNHPVRIGNRIRILDKDFDLVGRVVDITGFYFFMETDDGRDISLPNSLVIQKGIEILGDLIEKEDEEHH